MAINVSTINRYLRPEILAQELVVKTPVRTPVWSRIFKKVGMHAFPHISVSTVKKTTGNLPILRRGQASIAVHDGEDSQTLFNPQPIGVNTSLRASDFLDLAGMNGETVQHWVGDQVSDLRDRAYMTIEALCCQAAKGNINYSMKVAEGGGLGTYNVNYGSLIPNPTITGGWGTATIDKIFEDLMLISNSITDSTRFGDEISYLVGKDVYFAVLKKLNDSTTTTKINYKVSEKRLELNGVVLEYFGDAGYTDLATGNYVKFCADNEIFAFAENAPFELKYLPIDDFDAQGSPKLEVSPFFVKSVLVKDPSAITVIAQTKPFPLPVPSASLLIDVMS